MMSFLAAHTSHDYAAIFVIPNADEESQDFSLRSE